MTHSPRHRLRCVAACLTVFSAVVGDVTRGQDTEPAPVEVRAVTGDGVTGRLVSLTDTLTVDVAGETSRTLPLNTVISLSVAADEHPAADPPAMVLLVNGDHIAGRTTAVQDDVLTLLPPGDDAAESLAIPLEYVRSMVFSQPREELPRHRLRRQWALLQPGADRVLFLNGTYTDGELVAIDDKQLKLKTNLGPFEPPREEVCAVIMNAELVAEPPQPSDYAILQTSDGSRLTLTGLTSNDGVALEGRSVCSTAFRVRLEDVVRLQFFGERIVSLADREPLEFVFTPYLTEQHPLVRHRNVHGGPLRLRGREFSVGLGMHSRSEVTYDLSDQGFKRFEAVLGVDDMADGQGHVEFVVEVDGARVFESGDVTGRREPIALGPLDVSGAERLKLIVDFGRVGNIRDIADWCDPVLIK